MVSNAEKINPTEHEQDELSSLPEHYSSTPDRADNRAESVSEVGEKPQETQDSLRQEALEQAANAEQASSSVAGKEKSPVERRKDEPISKSQREASYKSTIKQVQNELSASSKAFSKIIHQKAIDQASEVAGKTIARPNAILYGAIFAFALTLGVYLIAKYYGYPLSGSESIGAFIIGWIIGLLVDYFRIMITGKK